MINIHKITWVNIFKLLQTVLIFIYMCIDPLNNVKRVLKVFYSNMQMSTPYAKQRISIKLKIK